MTEVQKRIAALVAALVAVAGVVGIELGAVEADALTEHLAGGFAALAAAYGIARNWLAKFL